MQEVFIDKDCIFDYTAGKWSVFVIVDDHGEPVRVEATREHVERVFGVDGPSESEKGTRGSGGESAGRNCTLGWMWSRRAPSV